MIETIEWHPASQPPTNDDIILIQLANGRVDAGYYRGGEYYFVGDDVVCDVAYWAEWPKGMSDDLE